VKGMVKVLEMADADGEYLQCTSCLCSNETKKIYSIIVGKTERQTMTLKLCIDCLTALKVKINNVVDNP
jgi:hypothetical protein